MASFSIVLKWQIHVINSIQCSSISTLVESFRKKKQQNFRHWQGVFENVVLGDFRENNAAENFCQCALSTAEASLCRGEAKKKARQRRSHGLATL